MGFAPFFYDQLAFLFNHWLLSVSRHLAGIILASDVFLFSS
jgi:hypothetical protein